MWIFHQKSLEVAIMDSLRHQLTLNDLTFTDMISARFTDLIGVSDNSVPGKLWTELN